MSYPAEAERDIHQMGWVSPKYSKRRVDRAGKTYVSATGADLVEWDESLRIIDNWRAAHGFPLNTLQMLLRQRARRVDQSAIVVQRLKRLPSIEAKLLKRNSLGLSRIQDIGGCRAVVGTIAELAVLRDAFTVRGRDAHGLKKIDDYVWERGPRHTGYRSVHLIYAFQSSTTPQYNGLLIEVQLRTRLQHAWATAVETVAAFIGEPLKAGEGSAEWLRFFSLMGSEIAIREKTPAVPDTPVTRKHLREEIRELAQSLNVVDRLEAYQTAMNVAERGLGDASAAFYFILLRNAPAGDVTIYGYTKRGLSQATEAYQELEAQTSNIPGSDVVLVSADDLKTVQRAYPNYFADTTEFLKIVRQAVRT